MNQPIFNCGINHLLKPLVIFIKFQLKLLLQLTKTQIFVT